MLQTADALFATNDYVSAIKTIREAVNQIGEDVELITAKETYENAYAESVSAQVDTYLAEQNISAAKDVLKVAAKEIPENELIQTRTAEVEQYKTVRLDTLTPINGEFPWNEETPGDPFGNTYTGAQNYAVFHAEDYGGRSHSYEALYSVEYKIDKQYDCLSFSLTPYLDFEQNGTSYVQVYVDETLRYTSSLITQKTQPYNVQVDIKDATYIKIQVCISGYGCSMLSDVMLSCVPNYVSTHTKDDTSLAVLDVFNGGFPWNEEFPQNTRGDSYTEAKNYTVLHGEDYGGKSHSYKASYSVEYFINKKYTSMSFDIAPTADFGANGGSNVMVYVDDVLVYTSPRVTQKTEKFNTGEIDLSNAAYVKIVAEIGEYGCSIISDVLLKNAVTE